ncbi:uncharacterized protein HMPREF1541_09478 [Cyphellophora europaea CBS 101466]|uniref:CENP-V/GFA domain-containing protein n=1 Tax=Cyphellophora europaea (strain CBS 101466) TaxID=1220924 RepID=W2SA88_CYPE1|nr:uncharacterized protein HMPREF1541_09478 [Cyphellophora europaea CBS 101466]ETN45646.1 hypothetical protein HMPREF1541_09478 [Cyphellophora europaea CBS 101466]
MANIARPADKSVPYYPVSSLAGDGWTSDDEATATCYCGSVQLAFPLKKPGLVNTFLCHCADCHKITATMFATSFTVKNDAIRWLRGKETLTKLAQSKTIPTGHVMTNHFCPKCGTLMARDSSGFPDVSFLRQGTVDNFSLTDGQMHPELEIFVKQRADWIKPLPGAKQFEEMWT